MRLPHPRFAFPAAAAILAVAVPVTLLGEGDPPPRAAAARIAVPPRALEPVPAGSLSFAMTAPPFDPDRTPGARPAEAAAEAAPAPPPAPVPRLVGVAAGGRGRAVALVRGANGETTVLNRGQAVDGWRLVGIGRQEAVFALGGERRTVRLDFGNKPAGAAPDAPPAPSASAPSPLPQIPPPQTREP